MRKQLIALLFLVIIDISISSEVQSSSDKKLINSDVLNKKLLPDVKHLMKDIIDGDRQKFLHLLNNLEVDGYKFVNGMCKLNIPWNFKFALKIPDHESQHNSFRILYAFCFVYNAVLVTHFDVKQV